MDYICKFDIELDRDIYYAGETLTGNIAVSNTENIKVQRIRLIVRGKAHAEWKVNRAGERRTIKQDEYYIKEQRVVWGKDKKEESTCVPIMPRGNHRYPFDIKLPESALPCSFESKIGTIRYYLRVTMDIPYASPPQGIKYFTIIGPHIDCMDERYLAPCHAKDKRYSCCLCCTKGPIVLQATLERSAYCCGEHIKLKAETQNGSDQKVWIVCKLIQYVEYFINKGVLGLNKDISHKVWEHRTDPVSPHKTMKYEDLQERLQVPVMPPTLLNVCSLVQVYYTLKVVLVMEKAGEALDLEFPITIATVPFRIPNAPTPELLTEVASSNVEGGIYISSEFQMGQVYMGETDDNDMDEVILYRPVYACVPHQRICVTNTGKDSEGSLELSGKGSRENSEITVKDSGRNISPSDTKAPPDILGRVSEAAAVTSTNIEQADISRKKSSAFEELELEEISTERNENTEHGASPSLSTHSVQSGSRGLVTKKSSSEVGLPLEQEYET
ncbi:hypothetical protein ScPMuIL_000100 [Solemya velum]